MVLKVKYKGKRCWMVLKVKYKGKRCWMVLKVKNKGKTQNVAEMELKVQ